MNITHHPLLCGIMLANTPLLKLNGVICISKTIKWDCQRSLWKINKSKNNNKMARLNYQM